MWDRDKLKGVVNAIFGKPKTPPLPPRKEFENKAATAHDLKLAADERLKQRRELSRSSAASRDEDMKTAIADVARQHATTKLTPRGKTEPRSRAEIEQAGKKLYESRQQKKKDDINRKPVRELVEDAAKRAKKAAELPKGIRNKDVNFFGRVEGGPRLADNISHRRIGALMLGAAGDQALRAETKKALRAALPEWMGIKEREASVFARVAAIEAMQQQSKSEKAGKSLTEAERKELQAVAARGDIHETAEAILAAGKRGPTPKDRAARVNEAAAVIEVAHNAPPAVMKAEQQQPSKKEKAGKLLTEAERKELQAVAARGDIHETAEAIFATGKRGLTPEDCAARVSEATAVIEAAQRADIIKARVEAAHAADAAALSQGDYDIGRTI